MKVKKKKAAAAQPSAHGEEAVTVVVRLRPEPEYAAKAGRHDGSMCLFKHDDHTLELRSPPEQPEHTASQSTVASLAGQAGSPAVSGRHGGGGGGGGGGRPRLFHFDRVFDGAATQQDVYATVFPLVRSAIRGYNATAFAYGSTGSGKTFTMVGTPRDGGMVMRAVDTIFSTLSNVAAQQSDALFHVQMSFVELYNNTFRNLLDGGGGGGGGAHEGGHAAAQAHKIEVHESESEGVHLTGPRLRVHVTSAPEVMRLLKQGTRLRAVGATNLNEHSSRSHSILTFHIESKSHDVELLPLDTPPSPSASASASGGAERGQRNGAGGIGGAHLAAPAASPVGTKAAVAGGAAAAAAAAAASPAQRPTIVRMGKLHLIDLAGSERVALSGAEGGTLVEAQNINLSLTALGDVLNTLSHNSGSRGRASSSHAQQQRRVPYRNSKLTFFLKDSLGGNSKTIMITNLRCRATFYSASLVALLYAARAKKIKNCSTVNMDTVGDRSKITEVEREVELLRSRLVQRTIAFEDLERERCTGASENAELKARIAQLASTNGREKMELEAYMTKVGGGW
jgi:hypothetical protein